MTSDVVVEISRSSEKPFALIEPGRSFTKGFLGSSLAMVNFAPKATTDVSYLCQEFVFVVDRSGSMSGPLMKNAIDTVVTFLLNLPHTNTTYFFNVVSFGTRYEFLWNHSQPCTAPNIRKAISTVQLFKANLGGTQLLGPLKWVMEQNLMFKKRNVIVVTDGAVSNTKDVV